MGVNSIPNQGTAVVTMDAEGRGVMCYVDIYVVSFRCVGDTLCGDCTATSAITQHKRHISMRYNTLIVEIGINISFKFPIL